MKKVLSIILIIASVLTLFCACNKEKVDESGLYSYVVLDDDTAKITKYNGTEPVVELKIPSALDDYTVTVIGTEAFKDVQTITVVRTPDTLTKIEDYAFANSSVKKALMNRSPLLTEIGAYAFSECKNLVQTDMPRELETLGTYAFNYCENLKIAQFRGDKVKIGEFAFDACPKAVFYIRSTSTNVKSYADMYKFEVKFTDVK
ncbi:MAG: leucine-rich repeat domain-containing protein [Acutalibacteraceae bacterium]|nr:leucine-rich repeat domain-containing protein [Acutalibacteraceae bacterium]